MQRTTKQRPNHELFNTITQPADPRDSYKVIKNWLKQGIESIPKSHPKDKNKRFELSEKSKTTLGERKQAAKDRNPKLLPELSRKPSRNGKEDKKTRILEAASKDLDLRDRWLGIRELKRKYTPTPYHNKDRQGLHISHKNRAQHAAKHLSELQWGEVHQEIQATLNRTPIINQADQNYNTDVPTTQEILIAIIKLKRRKAPGPDEIPTELLKELKAENLEELQKILSIWWNQENICAEELKARVVLIYKKGDTNKFENYRPISLLNTLYEHIRSYNTKRNLRQTR